jgi:hypothetical protein
VASRATFVIDEFPNPYVTPDGDSIARPVGW